jgi:hypothetical protein
MQRYFCLFLAGLIGCALLAAPASAAETKTMFDGKSLEGWDFFLQDSNAKMEDVWSVRDGMIICKGKPMGFLATKEKFKDFKLVVEWRWAPGTKKDSRPNSGVLLRITGDKKMLPKCVEAQLMSGSAGDIWAFEGFKVKGDTERFREIPNRQMCGLSKIEGAEKELGEWNKYEITLVGDKLTLVVNGKKVNECTGCNEVAGQIGLQSEGGEIHFRTVEVTPMGD